MIPRFEIQRSPVIATGSKMAQWVRILRTSKTALGGVGVGARQKAKRPPRLEISELAIKSILC
jgi:hypothetical protein